MGYKLEYHILVLPNQVLLINSVLTNEVLLYVLNGLFTETSCPVSLYQYQYQKSYLSWEGQ